MERFQHGLSQLWILCSTQPCGMWELCWLFADATDRKLPHTCCMLCRYLENNPGLVIPDAFKALPSLKVGDYAAMPPTAAHQGPPATPAAPAAAGLVSQGMNGLSLHNGSQQPAPSSHVAFLFDPVRLVEQQDKY
eukprot:GHRR01030783.1.p1 GENE.GHRR01030783.1~~GHRR01030783.1.p1  ORF type:complete len:135 (-),score=29.71 GHRR01030783.1:356-760(-)